MRRDPKIQKILPTDSQKDMVDKVNSNFLGLHFLAAGNLGFRGPTGPTGPLGLPGNPGLTGNDGVRGTRWFIGDSQPQGGLGDIIVDGDYWINSASDINPINKFSLAGWDETGYDLSANSEFYKIDSIERYTGATSGSAIFYKKTPEASTFNFSDVNLDITNANPLHGMFNISSDGNVSGAYSLLEFSRGDLVDGSPADFLNHPSFRFLNTKGDNSSVVLLVPKDELKIQTLDTTSQVPYDIKFNIGKDLNIRSSAGFTFGTSPNADDGMTIESTGYMGINAVGSYKPEYSNIEYDPASYNRISLNSRLVINPNNVNVPGIKVSSKVDTSTTGSGTLSVSLGGGDFNPSSDGYKPENYALKLSTINPGSASKDRFYITSAGSVYCQKEARGFTFINTPSNNLNYDGSTYRTWYLFGNITHTHFSSGTKSVCFANDKNEILINPIGLASGSKLSVGLQLNTLNGLSYLNNLKTIGETLKIKIRSTKENIKIDSVGITYVGAFGTSNNYQYPYTQVHKFTDPTTEVDLTLVKQVSGTISGGDLVYYKGAGESGVWTTQT